MTQIHENSKLIVISRRDLTSGSQAVQSSHALVQFIYEHPEISKEWYDISQYLVFLSTKNLIELTELVEKFNQKGIIVSMFYEPNMRNELTAIAIEPSSKARRMVSSLPLLLKNYEEKEVSL